MISLYEVLFNLGCGNHAQVQVLIQWSNAAPEDATWEDASYIHKQFPAFLAQPFLLTPFIPYFRRTKMSSKDKDESTGDSVS